MSYYASHSPFTEPGDAADVLAGLPTDLRALRQIANGLVIHFRLGDLAGAGIPEERVAEVDSRYADLMLARLRELDPRPLSVRRPPERRLVGCCRDFTVLLLTMARTLGLPARARVGFATYLYPGAYGDHAVAEIWDGAERRWRLVDAQLGEDHVDPGDGVPIDPLDVPRDRFLVAGAAWQMCRSGAADPATFIVRPDVDATATRGWPYVARNLVMDLAALNKMEVLLWDLWGLAGRALMWNSLGPDEMATLERIAAITSPAAPDLGELRSLYEGDERLRVSDRVTSFSPATMRPRRVSLRAIPAEAA